MVEIQRDCVVKASITVEELVLKFDMESQMNQFFPTRNTRTILSVRVDKKDQQHP